MPPASLNIPRGRLFDLYINQKLSSDMIAKKLGCNHVTILNYLKKYGIPRRSRLGNRKPVELPKELLLDLYYKRKLTQEQIAQQFCHSRFGIQRWMKIYGIKSKSASETHTKYRKKNFSGNLLEKAYIIGFRLGDLNVSKIRELVQVRCSTTKEAQVDLIKNLFEKYGNVHVWKAKRGTLEIIVLLNKSFNFLLPKKDYIGNWILAKEEYFLSFLAGYADAEGSYYLRKPYYKFAKTGWGIFEISSFDGIILRNAQNQLKLLGIESAFTKSRPGGHVDKRGLKTNNDVWRLSIARKQVLWSFIKLIGLYHRHRDKLKDLSEVRGNLLLRNKLPYYRAINL